MTANMIRQLRVWRGETQAEFAKQLRVSYSLVTKWETNARRPQGPALLLLRQLWHQYRARAGAAGVADRSATHDSTR